MYLLAVKLQGDFSRQRGRMSICVCKKKKINICSKKRAKETSVLLGAK